MNPDKVVHNASDRTLTKDEKQVLALGLNFAVTPKDMDDTIVILPADKGNATVVMNRKDYDGRWED